MKIIFFKQAYFIMLLVLVSFVTTSYAQKDFSKLTVSKDSSLGYTDQNPLKLKKGNQAKSIANAYKFLTGLKTQDNQTLTLLSRAAVENPNYTEPDIKLHNRYTGMPLSGKLGLLDKYLFLTSNTKDTLTLFVDIYNKGDLYVPVGLKYEQKEK